MKASTFEFNAVRITPLNQILSDELMRCVKLPNTCSAFKFTFDSCREFRLRIPFCAEDAIFTSISYS